MATELYGVDARLVDSIARTPVSTETTIIFIGASASGALNKPVLITSLADYETKLGGVPGDGYNLTEAAIAAFTVANIDKCWMIPVSNSKNFSASDYTGSAELETGVYAIDKLLRESPTMVNILCAPGIQNYLVIDALNTIAQKAAGHWQSFVVYDVFQKADQINDSGIVDVSKVVFEKQLTSERARAVWGYVMTSGGYIISGAAVQACLMAVSDSNYGVPARCGGNLTVNGIQSIQSVKKKQIPTEIQASIGSAGFSCVYTLTGDYADYTGTATCFVEFSNDVSKTADVSFTNGQGTMFVESSTTGVSVSDYEVYINEMTAVNIKESDGTQLSADGICSWINYGGGNWHTWGDHTSAFANNTISDERGRFDNYMRMQMMIANRFQYIYRFSIDDPMTLQMRNDVITEEQNFMNGLVAIGALIGQPRVEFVQTDNPIDNVAQGYFTWSIATTEAPPLKYMLAKVAYTQAGLEVFTQEG